MRQAGLYFLLLLAVASGCDRSSVVPKVEEEFNELKVMTFNVLYSVDNSITLKVLRETFPDVIGFQEISVEKLNDLATKLKYHQHHFPKTRANMSNQDTGILSRFPIVRLLTDGVVVQVNKNLQVAVFTVHLSPYPYEPYDFRDGIITTPEQAIGSASQTRLPEIGPVITQIESMKAENIPVFVTGDFNEPSHLDWNATTAASNLHFGKTVSWPVSNAVADAGLIDAYRLKFSNAANFPGNTWTPIRTPDEVYDRIDIIYHSPDNAYSLNDIRLVGGPLDGSGISVEGYASDHFAVVATYSLNTQ
ncbi:MAG: endonuclease/exonuclease/phosphatase family protein [Cytophagales bacterium]|nr:endonuclease/exonuclease/phosphatase family protein [Cytophagales bacterium]